jgi:hypothetical protein
VFGLVPASFICRSFASSSSKGNLHRDGGECVRLAGVAPKRWAADSFERGMPIPTAQKAPRTGGRVGGPGVVAAPTLRRSVRCTGGKRARPCPIPQTFALCPPIDYRVTVLDPLGDKAAMTR